MSSKSDIAVSVRGLSKAYTIVHHGEKHVTLAESLLAKARRPFARLPKETFWALKDVDFEIKKGEVVGIIGRNGAGKSTLLKVLSRITEPTVGEIDLYGRVGSLLEVGTGFHPELTGRENIFLNGAILGMTKEEIRKQFDPIVDFAGVARFLDTPVKRYSSGMYVRLAFAVSAHLDADILIVDEVLAVGDSEFQKKCLSRIGEVSNFGRTVIFVSHSMSAVQSLCPRCIWLKAGKMQAIGRTQEVVAKYVEAGVQRVEFARDFVANGNPRITKGTITQHPERDEVTLEVEITASRPMGASLDLRLADAAGSPVAFGSLGTLDPAKSLALVTGVNCISFSVSTNRLALGAYSISFDLTLPGAEYYDRVHDCLAFDNMRLAERPGIRVTHQSWGYGSMELDLITASKSN